MGWKRTPEHARAELKRGALAEGLPGLLPVSVCVGGGPCTPSPPPVPGAHPQGSTWSPSAHCGTGAGSMGPQGNWSLCASPLGAPIQEILIIPHVSSPRCPKSSVAPWRCLCYVPFTLKPNDGISTRGFVNSLPPKASSIRDRTVLELGPCSVSVTCGALRVPL